MWRHRLDGQFFSSPIAADDSAYFTNGEGRTTIVSCDRVFRLIAENELEEPVIASPAAVERRLYIRSERSLFAIRDTPALGGSGR